MKFGSINLLTVCALSAGAAIAAPVPGQELTGIAYTPAVAIIPEVRTPGGEMRSYRTSDGATYWHAGLPIHQGDHVKLNVFVSSGGANLAETRVRLDNVEVARRTAAPWDSTVDTGHLSEGYHFVEAWARTDGTDPRASTDTQVFFVDPHPVEQPTMATPPATVIPPPADSSVPVIESGSGGPPAQVSSEDLDVSRAMRAGARIVLDKPVEFIVRGLPADGGYVYALYRGDKQIQKSERLAGDTRVKLRPAGASQPGLLPGIIYFVVWGADKDGRLGTPSVTEIEVAANGAAQTTSS